MSVVGRVSIAELIRRAAFDLYAVSTNGVLPEDERQEVMDTRPDGHAMKLTHLGFAIDSSTLELLQDLTIGNRITRSEVLRLAVRRFIRVAGVSVTEEEFCKGQGKSYARRNIDAVAVTAQLNQGLTAKQIADDLGISNTTLLRYRQSAGIRVPKKISLVDPELAMTLKKQGLSYQEIALRFGVSPATLFAAMKKAGVGTREAPRPRKAKLAA